MLTFSRRRQAGLGILEVIVAAGLFSLIGAGIMTLISNSFKQQRGIEAKDGMRQFSADVEHLLSSNGACINTFTGLVFDANNQITITQIKDGTPAATVRFNSGDPYAGLLTFQNARLQDFVADNPATNPNLGKAKLFLYTRKIGDTQSAPVMHQVLSLKVLRTAAGGIQDCSSTNTTNFWLSSPSNLNNIYYDSGNVGIGVNNPTARLDVAGSIKPGPATIGQSCSPEGAFAYDSAANTPVYCNDTAVWAKLGGGDVLPGTFCGIRVTGDGRGPRLRLCDGHDPTVSCPDGYSRHSYPGFDYVWHNVCMKD